MSIVYFTKDISPKGLIKAYKALGITLQGKLAVKISTGEPGGHNYLKPELIKDLISSLKGTIAECNTAYEGKRHTNEDSWQTFKEHGFTLIELLLKSGLFSNAEKTAFNQLSQTIK